MADPISLLAVAGLVYAGRTLSQNKTEKYSPEAKVAMTNDGMGAAAPSFKQTDFVSRVELPAKREMESFAVISRQQRSGGQEILDMRNRLYDQGKMNNLSPIEKQLVGPGLGLAPEVPAAGGFHQQYRVMPTNVGEYKLTQLPGRANHGADTMGGRRGLVGDVVKNRPERTTELFERLPTARGRAQGMSAITPRQEHE